MLLRIKMYKNVFDNHIRNKTVSNSFVFFGESSFLIDTYTKLMTNIEDASTLTLYHDEYDFKVAKAHLSQASLFGGENILIIKTEKKVPKKELDALISLCEKNKDNILVYAYYGSDYKTYNAKSFLSKVSTMVVRFFNPNQHEAINIISQAAKEKNINISNYSIVHLLNIHNSDVALAYNELDKFKLLDKEITTKDIDNLVSGLADISMQDFIKVVVSKKDFTNMLQNILEHGEDEIRVLTSLIAYFTELYLFNIYIRVNGSVDAIEVLGYKPPAYIINEKSQLSLKFKPATYYKLHSLLLESELKMKSSNVDKGAILLSTLIRVQKVL
jgi:DNA polymerase-3 subunit delta